MAKQFPLSTILMAAGLLPFLGYAALEVSNLWDGTQFIYGLREVILAYALMILSFMAGVHWGQHLGRDDKWLRVLPLASNAVALLGWLAFIALSNQATMYAFVVLFIAVLVVDWLLEIEGLITAGYFKLRCLITAVVCLCLLASAVVY